ncbi:hypothetical protein F5880DRAFT_1482869 [Lentinula raphanica]|nr:hypothetical protein F5880DRAFT_1482869 [Lentinula raphanica]
MHTVCTHSDHAIFPLTSFSERLQRVFSPSSETSNPQASDVTPSDESTWYVVYHGRNGCQGLFEGYSTTARALSYDYEHRLMKRFQHEADATRSYKECEACGILDLLRPLPHNREIFIVAEGALPGVYLMLSSRLSLMIEGLNWRGGRVVSFVGTYQDAKSLFQEWDSSGQTSVLTNDISRLNINSHEEDIGNDGDSGDELGLDSVTIISDDDDDLYELAA